MMLTSHSAFLRRAPRPTSVSGPSPQSSSCAFRDVVRILYCFPREGREETIVNAYYMLTNLLIAPCNLGKVLSSTSNRYN